MGYLILFLFGATMGSFLGVVADRYKLGNRILFSASLQGRSRCEYCDKTLRWYELIPFVSFCVQRGRCRNCKAKLSFRYVGTELITGLITLALPLVFYKYFGFALLASTLPATFYIFTGLWILVAYTCIVISLIDIRYSIIPDQGTAFLVVLAILLLLIKGGAPNQFPNHGSFLGLYKNIFSFGLSLWLEAIFAAGIGLLFFGAIIALTKGRGMGLGDLKFAAAVGLLLGWPDAIFALFFAFIIGAGCAVPLLIRQKGAMGKSVPFGPFLCTAIFVIVIYGAPILKIYFSLT